MALSLTLPSSNLKLPIMTARNFLNNSLLFFSFLLFVVVNVPAFCKLPKVTGPCRAAARRWYFNKVTGKCQQFIYGGCRGNRNNFNTRKECEKKCGRCKSEWIINANNVIKKLNYAIFVTTRLLFGFSKVPKFFGAISAARIPFLSSQRRGSKPSNLAILFILLR